MKIIYKIYKFQLLPNKKQIDKKASVNVLKEGLKTYR